MNKDFSIPAYKVRIVQERGGQRRTLAEKVFTDGPGTDQAFIDKPYEAGQRWSHVAVRQKTDEGSVQVTTRHRGSNRIMQTASPDQSATIAQGGRHFTIEVEAMPKVSWKSAAVLDFKAPKVTVEAKNGGWEITFEPQQYPCVATVAVQANLVKDESLPSFPFPQTPQHRQGSFFIAQGQFKAEVGALVRFGVRGAGRSVTIALPDEGKTVKVKSSQFKVGGAANASMLSESYVRNKYQEKAGQIRYS